MDAVTFTTTRRPARAVSASDIGACYNLVKNIRHFYEASDEGWDRRVKFSELKYTPGLEYLLVKRGRKLAAFASFVVDDRDDDFNENLAFLYVWEIHVSPQFYRQRLGHKLIKELTKIAREAEQPAIMLRCFRDNLAARKFYEKEGFVEVHERADEFCLMYFKPVLRKAEVLEKSPPNNE